MGKLTNVLRRAVELERVKNWRSPMQLTEEAATPTSEPPAPTSPTPETPQEVAEPEDAEEAAEPEDTSYECPECGTHHDTREDGHVTHSNGTNACTECSTTCPECDEWHDPDNMVEVHTGNRVYSGGRRREVMQNVCQDCFDSGPYFECGDCQENFHTDASGGRNTDDNRVCQSCGENYFYCDSCHSTFHNDDYGEDGNCRECSQGDQESDLIHRYGYEPDELIFHGKGRHYGVELETVVGAGGDLHDAAEHVVDTLGDDFAYLKEDGSLSGGVGQFEITTHPATLPIHKERWEKLFNNLPSKLKSESHSCCGLHIHVEKAGLSELDIYKMHAFTNAVSNREFVEAIARRRTSYAKIAPKPVKDVIGKFVPRPHGGLQIVPPRDSLDRREALNLLPDNTVEFRIFKGTLNKVKFYQALEFADAVTEFAKSGISSIVDVQGLGPFFRFVASRAKEYPHLNEFCRNFAKEREQAEQRAREESMMSAQLSRRTVRRNPRQSQQT